MFDNIVSIDIGSSSVKLIKAKRSIRNFEITAAIIEDINQDDAHSDNAAALKNCFERITDRVDLTDSSVILSVPSDQVYLRNINFPFSEMSKIREAIPYEAEENIPYSPDRIIMDFQPLPHNENEGRSVILAAVDKEIFDETLNLLSGFGINPVFAGLESNALVKSYDYFNSVNNEKILLIDVGMNKTLISIIMDNALLYTRSISAGTGLIIRYIADILNISISEASLIFEQLELDLHSTGSDKIMDIGPDISITKPKLKKIYLHAADVLNSIITDVLLSIRTSGIVKDYSDFNRIMLSGGGSNIKGIAKLLSDESGLPVVFMPFISEYTDKNIRSRLSVALGNLLVFMNSRNESINFLKERTRQYALAGAGSRYSLAKFFIVMSSVIFLFNLLLTFYSVYKSNSYSDDILRQKYKRYFNTQTIPKDPVAEAAKLLQKERQELKILRDMIGEKSSFTGIIGIVTKSFTGIPGYYVKKMTFEGNDMTIEGEVKNSRDLEQYKNNIMQTGKFESVSVNITDTNRERSLFKMMIKQKTSTEQR